MLELQDRLTRRFASGAYFKKRNVYNANPLLHSFLEKLGLSPRFSKHKQTEHYK